MRFISYVLIRYHPDRDLTTLPLKLDAIYLVISCACLGEQKNETSKRPLFKHVPEPEYNAGNTSSSL